MARTLQLVGAKQNKQMSDYLCLNLVYLWVASLCVFVALRQWVAYHGCHTCGWPTCVHVALRQLVAYLLVAYMCAGGLETVGCLPVGVLPVGGLPVGGLPVSMWP